MSQTIIAIVISLVLQIRDSDGDSIGTSSWPRLELWHPQNGKESQEAQPANFVQVLLKEAGVKDTSERTRS